MMKVTVFLKDGRDFTFGETAVFSDDEAGWLILSQGSVSGNRLNLPWPDREKYTVKDESHIAYRWCDVERVEIRAKGADHYGRTEAEAL